METATAGSNNDATTTQDTSFTTGLDNITHAINFQPLETNDSQQNQNLWNNIMHDFHQVYPPIDEKARKKIAASRKDIENDVIV